MDYQCIDSCMCVELHVIVQPAPVYIWGRGRVYSIRVKFARGTRFFSLREPRDEQTFRSSTSTV